MNKKVERKPVEGEVMETKREKKKGRQIDPENYERARTGRIPRKGRKAKIGSNKGWGRKENGGSMRIKSGLEKRGIKGNVKERRTS